MTQSPAKSCGCQDVPDKRVPFRLPFVAAGTLQASTCPADGFVVFVPDGAVPGVYVSIGGKWCRLPTEEQICDLIRGAVQKLVGGA